MLSPDLGAYFQNACTIAQAVLAVNDRRNKKKAAKKEYPPAEDLLYNVLRAALAIIAFGAGALLSAPASVCLFPGDTPVWPRSISTLVSKINVDGIGSNQCTGENRKSCDRR